MTRSRRCLATVAEVAIEILRKGQRIAEAESDGWDLVKMNVSDKFEEIY